VRAWEKRKFQVFLIQAKLTEESLVNLYMDITRLHQEKKKRRKKTREYACTYAAQGVRGTADELGALRAHRGNTVVVPSAFGARSATNGKLGASWLIHPSGHLRFLVARLPRN